MSTSSRIFLRQRPAAVAGIITVGGLGAWVAKSFLTRDVYAESPSSPAPSKASKVFSGPFGPSLRLESSEMVNHNTKRLRFSFPNPDATSGLSLTCKSFHVLPRPSVLMKAASVLTVSWPKGRWFPVLRPYTPISALGISPFLHFSISPRRASMPGHYGVSTNPSLQTNQDP